MEHLEIDISNENSLPDAAEKILKFSGNTKIFAVNGPMGSGKTTFIKQLCKKLGCENNLSSPTYSIVNEYLSAQSKIYHFDLFRIKNISELYDLGFEEYCDGKNYCFIEWPEKAFGILPLPYLSIIIIVNENNRYLRASIIK